MPFCPFQTRSKQQHRFSLHFFVEYMDCRGGSLVVEAPGQLLCLLILKSGAGGRSALTAAAREQYVV